MRKLLILTTLLFTISIHAQSTFNVDSPQSVGNLKVGDAHLGGTIVYFFKPGDSNYGKYVGIVAADSYYTDKQ